MNEADAKILRKVGDAEAFYFCKGLGNFAGKKANSMEDFLGMIQMVDSESLEFHVDRGDFEKWVASTIGYAQLAAVLIDGVGGGGLNFSPEAYQFLEN